MSSKDFDVNEYVDQYPDDEHRLREYGTDSRRVDANGIPESTPLYASTWCLQCGGTFEYEAGSDTARYFKRKFCSDECQKKHAETLAKPDADQQAINDYLARNPVREW